MKRTISESALVKRQKQSPSFFFDLLAEHGNLFQAVCMHLPFQTFARLARINPFYRNLITNCTPAKIDQWLELHAHEKPETERLVYAWRAQRMFVDKQINQIQYTLFIDELYCDTPRDNRPLLKKWDAIWGGNPTRQQFIRCRPPDESLLSKDVYSGCEILLLGYRPATVALRYTKEHVCEIEEPGDMDISLFQQSCPDHILMSKLACDPIRSVIYNVVDFALLESMPYFFKMMKFVRYRKTPYTAAMISKLGSPSEYFDICLDYGNYFPPVDLIKWLHSSIANIDFGIFMQRHFRHSDVFPCFNESIHYLMTNHCIDEYIDRMTTTGKINKRGYAPLKSAIESMPK